MDKNYTADRTRRTNNRTDGRPQPSDVTQRARTRARPARTATQKNFTATSESNGGGMTALTRAQQEGAARNGAQRRNVVPTNSAAEWATQTKAWRQSAEKAAQTIARPRSEAQADSNAKTSSEQVAARRLPCPALPERAVRTVVLVIISLSYGPIKFTKFLYLTCATSTNLMARIAQCRRA